MIARTFVPAVCTHRVSGRFVCCSCYTCCCCVGRIVVFYVPADGLDKRGACFALVPTFTPVTDLRQIRRTTRRKCSGKCSLVSSSLSSHVSCFPSFVCRCLCVSGCRVRLVSSSDPKRRLISSLLQIKNVPTHCLICCCLPFCIHKKVEFSLRLQT